MRRFFAGVVVLAAVPLGLPAYVADEKDVAAFEALNKDHADKLEAAKTVEDRKEVNQQFAGRYLQFAEKHAKSPVAFYALLECVDASSGKDGPAAKALAILEKDHAGNKQMRTVVL